MSEKRSSIDFYFDFVSPYAYLAWLDLRELSQKRGITLNPRPVPFGKLLDHWGQLGPAEIRPKRQHVFKDCFRYAKLNGLPFQMPKEHPFKPVMTLRLALVSLSGDRQLEMIDVLFEAVWTKGINPASEADLETVLTQAGFDAKAMIAQTKDAVIKEELKAVSEEALKRQVFGVPFMFVGEEWFWGRDQIQWLELFLDGKDPIQGMDMVSELDRARGIDRKKVQS